MTIISVIIPIYNVQDYLDRCLTSCIVGNDTIQYILIDDGSTDNSYNIANNFCKKYSNVELIHQSNHGLSSARNVGLKRAKGEWVSFIDSDDFVSHDFFSKLEAVINKKFFNINVISLPAIKYADGKTNILQDGKNVVINNSKYVEDLMNGRKQIGVCFYLIRKKVFQENNLFFKEGTLFEDQFFTSKLLTYEERIGIISSDRIGFYYYRTREGSISLAKPTNKKIISQVNAEIYRDNILEDNFKQNPKIINLIKSHRLSVYFKGMLGAEIIGNKQLKKEYIELFRHAQAELPFPISIKTLIKIILSYVPKKLIKFLYY